MKNNGNEKKLIKRFQPPQFLSLCSIHSVGIYDAAFWSHGIPGIRRTLERAGSDGTVFAVVWIWTSFSWERAWFLLMFSFLLTISVFPTAGRRAGLDYSRKAPGSNPGHTGHTTPGIPPCINTPWERPTGYDRARHA